MKSPTKKTVARRKTAKKTPVKAPVKKTSAKKPRVKKAPVRKPLRGKVSALTKKAQSRLVSYLSLFLVAVLIAWGGRFVVQQQKIDEHKIEEARLAEVPRLSEDKKKGQESKREDARKADAVSQGKAALATEATRIAEAIRRADESWQAEADRQIQRAKRFKAELKVEAAKKAKDAKDAKDAKEIKAAKKSLDARKVDAVVQAKAAMAAEVARIKAAIHRADESWQAEVDRQKQRAKKVKETLAAKAKNKKKSQQKSKSKKKQKTQVASIPKKRPRLITGGPFELVNHDGKTVTDVSFHGNFTLIYFGYTYCPDICPTALDKIAMTLELLGKEQDKVTPIFISVDPERDLPEDLKGYLAHFNPRFVGLTGTPAQIKTALDAFRATSNKEEGADVDEVDYTINHTSLIYLMGPDGGYRAHFNDGYSPEMIASIIREFL